MERYGAPLVGERLIPFLLMIVGFFPISVSLVIALESFVGEKERHSIEPLLGSPLSDWQLYLGKLLAALMPPLLMAYLGIIVYLIGVYRTSDGGAADAAGAGDPAHPGAGAGNGQRGGGDLLADHLRARGQPAGLFHYHAHGAADPGRECDHVLGAATASCGG